MDSINKDANYIYCTPLISPNPTDKNMKLFPTVESIPGSILTSSGLT